MGTISTKYLLPLGDKKKTQVSLLSLGAEIKSLQYSRQRIGIEHEFDTYVQSWKQIPWTGVDLEILMFPHEEYLHVSASETEVKNIMKTLQLADYLENDEATILSRYHQYCEKNSKEPKKLVSFKSRD